MKRMIAIIGLLGLAACGDEHHTDTTNPNNTQDSNTDTVSYNGPKVAYNGRFVDTTTDDDTEAKEMAWSGSSISVRFTGTSVSMEMTTASNANTYFNISIDDGTPNVLRLTPGTHTYTVRSPDPSNPHTVRWSKISEATFASVTAATPVVSSDGELLPTRTPTGRYMEFIGDSITAGYGVWGTSSYCKEGGAPENESADEAYPHLVADAFESEYVQIAFSGKGVVTNNDCTSTNLVPSLYDYAIPPGVENANSVVWDSTQMTPDVIVVNMGTNDFAAAYNASLSCSTVSTSDAGMPPAAAYEAAYTSFIQKLRSTHPNAYVIIVYGPMLTTAQMATDKTYLDAVMANFTDGYVKLLAVGPQGASVGCDYHPNVATHVTTAKAIMQQIEALPLGWEATGDLASTH